MITLVVLASASFPAAAQPEPAAPLEVTVSQPAVEPPPLREFESAEALIREVRSTYTSQPFTERVEVRIITPTMKDRTSDVVIKVETTTESGVTRSYVKLGRQLTLWTSGATVRAVSSSNASSYFEAVLDQPLTATSLASILPPVPVPQLMWAFGCDACLGAVGDVRWQTITRQDVSGVFEMTGSGLHGPIRASFDARTLRLKEMDASLGEGVTMQLRCTQVEYSPDGEWDQDVSSRRPVTTLKELRPREPDVRVGTKLPALGLMTASLEAWQMSDAFVTPPGATTSAAVLVIFRNSAEGMALGAESIATAEHAAKALEQRRILGEKDLPAVSVRPIAMVEVGEVGSQSVRDAAAALGPLGAKLVWSSGGQAMISRFSESAPAVVVVIDRDQTVLASIPCDGEIKPDEVERAVVVAVESLLPMTLPTPVQTPPATEQPK